MIVKRIKGIKRVAFAPVLPKKKGFFMLIDSGANVECKPEMLQPVRCDGVDLYGKGDERFQAAGWDWPTSVRKSTRAASCSKKPMLLLKESGLHFVGNVEAREIPEDAADVVVADGFTGNMLLKMYEGVVDRHDADV